MPEVTLEFTPITRRAYDATLLRGVDGDTVNIDQAVRMVSIHIPESHLGGSAPIAQATLDRCRQRLVDGVYDEIDKPLRTHLLDRLSPDAANRHLKAGKKAGEEFARMRAERLVFHPDTGQAKLGVIVTGEVIEENGRLLAYVTPWLTPPLPPASDPRRRTFNLQMIETGWAATFLIYPSLQRDPDLNRAVHAAESAWTSASGHGTSSARTCFWAMSTGPASNSALKTHQTSLPSRRPNGSRKRSAGSAAMSAAVRSSACTATTASNRPTDSGFGRKTWTKPAKFSNCATCDTAAGVTPQNALIRRITRLQDRERVKPTDVRVMGR